jgi:hypothetical protein
LRRFLRRQTADNGSPYKRADIFKTHLFPQNISSSLLKIFVILYL